MTSNKLEIFRGDDKTFVCTVYDADDVLVDISGATISFTVRATVLGAIIFQLTVGSGITITDGSNGVFQIAVTPTNTTGETPGLYYYDIEMTLATKVYTIVQDNIEIKQDITYT